WAPATPAATSTTRPSRSRVATRPAPSTVSSARCTLWQRRAPTAGVGSSGTGWRSATRSIVARAALGTRDPRTWPTGH
ncbi:MAG: hypothetical protein AVDCRST_MAG75-2962, partial [uncultured Propionibacteriaceae bacterium]